MNPYNTVFDAKRLIGRKFADEEVQADMKHWPYKIIDKAGKPVIQVEYKGEEKQFVSRPGLVLYSLWSVSLTLDLSSIACRPPRKSLPWFSSR